HAGEDDPGQARADPADSDQPLEEQLLPLGPEAEQGDVVLADLGVDEQGDAVAGSPPLDLVEGGEGDVDLVADPLNVEQETLGGRAEEVALEVADHLQSRGLSPGGTGRAGRP